MEDLKEALTDARQVGPDISMVYEDRISGLSNELKVVRDRLKSSEENASKPSPLLLQLQEEMAEMKVRTKQFEIALHARKRRTSGIGLLAIRMHAACTLISDFELLTFNS